MIGRPERFWTTDGTGVEVDGEEPGVQEPTEKGYPAAETGTGNGTDPGVKTQPEEGTGATGVRRAHLVFVGAPDGRTLSMALHPAIERSRDPNPEGHPACLVVTAFREQSTEVARIVRRLLNDPGARVVPVTSVRRAGRVIAAAPLAVIAGEAKDLAALRREAALPLDSIRSIVILGLDTILASDAGEALATLFADLPAGVPYVAMLEQDSRKSEAFIAAHMHRARRVDVTPQPADPEATPGSGVTPHYIITGRNQRSEVLRTLLDDLDPPSIAVVAQSDEAREDALAALSELGVPVDGRNVQVGPAAPASHTSLVVFWDMPLSHGLLAQVLEARPVAAVALLAPEEVTAFKAMTGGTAAALTPPSGKAATVDRVQRLRSALRSILTDGTGVRASELALFGPLLDSFDAIEIAAAAVRLYETAHPVVSVSEPSDTRTAASQRARSSGNKAGGLSSGRRSPLKVFLAVGKRDRVRAGDIVGAIANESGIPGDRIGAIEIFESHSLVEFSDERDAEAVIDALRTVQLRGRRLGARLDDRVSPGGDDRERSGRNPTYHGRGGPVRTVGPRGHAGSHDDGGRRFPGGERKGGRPGGRGERSPTGRRDIGSSGGRSERPENRRHFEARRAFGDRAPWERVEPKREWSERGERMKHARRPRKDRAEERDFEDG